MPVSAENIRDAVRMGSEVFHTLKKELSAAGLATGVGDEGGFAPNLSSTRDALDFILKAIEKAGYQAGTDIRLALDVAASEMYDEKTKMYNLEGEGVKKTSAEMVAYYEMLVEKNKVMNLTGITEYEEVNEKHFVDSLSIIKAIKLDDVDNLIDSITLITIFMAITLYPII